MNIKQFLHYFLSITIGLSQCTSLFSIDPMQQNPAMQQVPGMPQLSLEDLQAMEQFVEAERAKMTDEQRAQFDQDVVQLTKEFEKMQQENPDQFNAFIDQMLFGQPAEEASSEQPAAVPAPMPEYVPEEAKKEEPVQPSIDSEKQEKLLKTINAIIKHTSSFLNKTATMIEFPAKLKKWIEQGKIAGWIQGYTWESSKNNVGIKEHIEKLVQKLNAIKEQDRATKTYKYVGAVLANEDLVKNLETLERKLKELEPKIELVELEPASKEVRAVMRSVLAAYLNALFALGIPQDIDAVIASFEPAAKKYREEEESYSKKATEESKKTPAAQRTVVAGHPDIPNYNYGGGNSGYNPYDYFPYNQQQSSYDGDSGREQGRQNEDKKTAEEKKDAGKDSKGSDKKESKEEETKDTPDDKKIRDGIKQLEGNMNDAAQAIESIVDRPQNAKIDSDAIATGVKKLKQATGNLNSLKIKIKKASTGKKLEGFKKEIREDRDLHKDTLNAVSKVSGATSGGDKKPKTVLPPAPTKKAVEISQETIKGLKTHAKKVVNKEIEQAIKEESAKPLRDYEMRSAGDSDEIKKAMQDTIIASIEEPYEQDREKMIKEKADELIKEYKQSEQAKADQAYEKAKAAWDTQAAQAASESKGEEGVYTLAELNTAAQEVLKAFSGF